MDETDAPFVKRVLEWVQQRDPDAAEVEKVESFGSDWSGDTEGGFYSTFSVNINYRQTTGDRRFLTVEGEDMASLWKWVVNNEVWA